MNQEIIMDNNYIELFRLIVDAIARIFVPIAVVVLGRKPIEQITKNRISFIEKQLREHTRGYSDEEQAFMDKTLKEVFSKPEMRCFW